MKKNIESLLGECSGCSGCSIICPTNAIKIKLSNEGFYNAFVDSNKCINCGLCTNVCMKKSINNANDILDGKVYAAQSKTSEVVKTCSSGGIAHEMSVYAINNNYLVVGVKYDYVTNSAVTFIVNNRSDLEKLKGSKYIQSYTEKAFKDIIDIAKRDSNQKILVFGTPCQIYGLASVLEKQKLREQFVLVDLFCHGVPSNLVWKNYLKKIGANEKEIELVKFRDKTIGWHNFVMEVQGKNFSYKKTSEGDLFYHTFFDNILLSKACFNCQVRKEKTKADIRLGDFWGRRYQKREDGVSAVLINTVEGEKYFRELENVSIIEVTSVEEVLESQSIYTYNNLDLREKAINELISSNNLEDTVKNYRKYFPLKKKLKLFLKELTSCLPNRVRAFLRKIYKIR